MTNLFSSVLHSLDERRAAKRDRALLERQMASYANHADRLDLQATLDRYPDEQTAELAASCPLGPPDHWPGSVHSEIFAGAEPGP